MPTIRVPLAEPLTNRDPSTTKDSKLVNCAVEDVGGQMAVIKRPGTFKQAQLSIALSQGIFTYNNVLFGITNDTLVSGPGATLVADGTTWTDIASFTTTSHLNTYLTCSDGTNVYTVDNSGTVYKFNGISWSNLGAQVGAYDGWFTSSNIYWNGYFWRMGGQNSSNVYLNTIQRSTDYVNWTTVTTSSSWGGRYKPSLFVYNNFIYLAGGYNGAYLTDVWQMTTNTGLNWSQVSNAAPAGAYGACILGTTFFAMNSSNFNMYKSTDSGITWTLIGALSYQGTVYGFQNYNNTLWYFTGNGAGGYKLVKTVDFLTYITVLSSTPFTAPQWLGVAQGALVEINDPDTVYTHQAWTAILNAPAGQVYPLTPSTANLYFDFSLAQSAAGQNGFFFKSTKDAYFFNNATLTKVTSANYPATTVPGVVYLDGTYYVGTPNGQIFGSAIEDPTTWSALNYVSAEIEPDPLVAIAKSLNNLVAFGQWSTEFFYDAGNATGSPLSSVPNAYFTIGCASGRSVVKTENAIVWMSQTYQRGRQIMMLNGFQPQTISTSEIDRILNADDLANVYSFSIKTNGSVFYVLTLKTSNKTLVYDFTSKQWHFWSTMVVQSPKSVTSLTYANGVVTVSQAAHGYADGDLITIAGATPSGYNGNKNITYIDSNTYSYLSASVLSSPATGTITATGYTEQYFNGTGYTYNSTNGDMIQGELDGAIYSMSPSYANDNGVYINTKIRTVRVDGGDAKRKFNSKAEIIADKIAATALIRYTDDDYQTYSTYRPIDLSAKRSMILRLGHTRRRAYEIRVTDSQPLRFGALELDMEKGSS